MPFSVFLQSPVLKAFIIRFLKTGSAIDQQGMLLRLSVALKDTIEDMKRRNPSVNVLDLSKELTHDETPLHLNNLTYLMALLQVEGTRIAGGCHFFRVFTLMGDDKTFSPEVWRTVVADIFAKFLATMMRATRDAEHVERLEACALFLIVQFNNVSKGLLQVTLHISNCPFLQSSVNIFLHILSSLLPPMS